MVINFVGIKFSWILLFFFHDSFMIRYMMFKVHNIYSTWFLDIRISGCSIQKLLRITTVELLLME